jgi:hypothetical protein
VAARDGLRFGFDAAAVCGTTAAQRELRIEREARA